MNEPRLRPATPDDLETLRRFQQGIVAAERPHDPTLKSGELYYYDLDALLRSPQVCFLLAEESGVPVGCGFVRIDAAKPYASHDRQGYLGLMYVLPAHRGRGLNGRLLEALKGWCTERGVTELRLDVYPGNEAAVRAYKKAGFAPHMLEMRLRLTP